MNYKETAVYWIHLPEHTDYYTQGYIGVSKKPITRMKKHISDCINGIHYNPHLLHAVNKYKQELLLQEIIFFGEEDFCYEFERVLRPSQSVGWNIAPGGHRGPGRPLGSRLSKESIEKGKQTRKRRKEERDSRFSAGIATLEDIIVEGKKLHIVRQNGIFKQRPICKLCNKNFCAINYKRNNITHYRGNCDECGRKKSKLKPRKPNWVKSGYKKKATCDLCGFHSITPTQITVFHIDGNLENIALSNLRSICLNCVEVVKKTNVTWKRGDLEVDY